VLHISKLLRNSLAIVNKMSITNKNHKGKQQISLVNNIHFLIDFKRHGSGTPFEYFLSYSSIEYVFLAWISSYELEAPSSYDR
jgi:hypothetical protein